MNIHTVNELPNIESRVVGIDIETTTTPGNKISNPWQDRIVTIAVSNGQEIWVIPPEGNMRSVVPLVNNPDVKKIGHNIKFDLGFFVQQLGAQPENVYDTMLISRLIHAGRGMKHALDDCLAYDLGVMIDKTTREQFYAHRESLTEEQINYVSGDVAYLLPLREKQIQQVGSAGLGKVAKLENKVVLTVVDMYLAGVEFDVDLWKEYEKWIRKELQDISEQVQSIIGCGYSKSFFGDIELAINLNSTTQIMNMFKAQGIKVANTQEKTLHKYLTKLHKGDQNSLVNLVLQYKGWRKMLGWKYEQKINPVTKHIHSDWNQLGTDTGRFSCKEPNLQQVPRPTEDEPNFRKLFKAPYGYMFVTLDWSQEEVRILAQACGDKALIEACQTGDVYIKMASDAFNKKVTKGSEERWQVKTGTLACAYGARAKKLAVTLRTSEELAENFRQTMLNTFPRMRHYTDSQLKSLVQKGYTTTLLGRRRYFDEIKDLRPDQYWKFGSEAVNTPIQGTAADIGKLAMWKMRDWYKGKSGIKPVLAIHDEFCVQVPKEDADVLKYDLIGIMEQAAAKICPDVIIPAEGEVSKTWEK